jgi:hypothetical protein
MSQQQTLRRIYCARQLFLAPDSTDRAFNNTTFSPVTTLNVLAGYDGREVQTTHHDVLGSAWVDICTVVRQLAAPSGNMSRLTVVALKLLTTFGWL